MKKVNLILLFASILALSVQAQLRTPPIDASPMDMAYFPNGYTFNKATGKETGQLITRVIYSRPQKKDRAVFGELVPYDKIWRVGANEATEIEFFVPVKIGDKTIPRGRYTLYVIPKANEWTFLINAETDIWGETGMGKGPKYDEAKEVVRITIPVEKLETDVEALSIGFQKTDTGANLLVAWEKAKVLLPIEVLPAQPVGIVEKRDQKSKKKNK